MLLVLGRSSGWNCHTFTQGIEFCKIITHEYFKVRSLINTINWQK